MKITQQGLMTFLMTSLGIFCVFYSQNPNVEQGSFFEFTKVIGAVFLVVSTILILATLIHFMDNVYSGRIQLFKPFTINFKFKNKKKSND